MEIKEFVVYSNNRKELDELHKLAINNGFIDDTAWNNLHKEDKYCYLFSSNKKLLSLFSHSCYPAKLYNLQSQKEEIYTLIGIKSKEMKKYQFVKSLSAYSVGDILTPEVKNIDVSGLKISIEALLQQGFIKEYKEPEYTAGDYIVGSFANYQEVRKIVDCKVEGNYLRWTQEDLNGDISRSFRHSWGLSKIRKATPEQIQAWNKTQQEYKERLKIYGYQVVFNLDNTVNVGCKKGIHKKYLDSMLLVAEFCNNYEVEMSFNTSKQIFIEDNSTNEYSAIEKVVNKLK